ncbi:hypothetical protein FKE98_11260 [Corynebacterium aurimucosum]|nr:hypothetical protein [Corynebacterium guaraldiae]
MQSAQRGVPSPGSWWWNWQQCRFNEAWRAPMGIDRNPVNLHHIGQDDRTAVVEITKQMHTENAKVLPLFHRMNGSGFPTDVTLDARASFREWRHTYWKEKALDYL